MSGQRHVAASFWSFAAERRAKRALRSLQPGTPFPHSLPPRRWSAARLFFPAALICCAGLLAGTDLNASDRKPKNRGVVDLHYEVVQQQMTRLLEHLGLAA